MPISRNSNDLVAELQRLHNTELQLLRNTERLGDAHVQELRRELESFTLNSINFEFETNYNILDHKIKSNKKKKKDEFVNNPVIKESKSRVLCWCCGNITNKKSTTTFELKSRSNLEITVCEHCMKTFFYTCAKCGDIHYIQDVRGYIGVEKDKTYCFSCFENMFFECSRCSETHCLAERWSYDGYFYCQACKKKDFIECNVCNEIVYKSNDYKYGGKYYCHAHFNDRFFNCHHCYHSHFKTESFMYRNRHYCKTCQLALFTKCYKCDVITAKDYKHNKHYFCQKCWEEMFFRCSYCGEVFVRSTIILHDSHNYCSSCYEHHIRYAVNRYYYKPEPMFQGDKGHHMGIELEVAFYNDDHHSFDYGDEVKRISQQLESFAYLKSDTSIGNCGHGGFEIVTHPMTWDWIKQNNEKFQPIFGLIKRGFKSYHAGSCGMHVHVGIKYITATQLHKILSFVYGTSGREIIKVFSLRNSENLERWASFDQDINLARRVIKKKRRDYDDHRRSTAVNLNHKDTIEFRFFRGTLKRETFFRNLEFVQALLFFTGDLNIGKGEMNAYKFIDFIWKNKKEYPRLHEYVNGDKFIEKIGQNLLELQKELTKNKK